MRRSDVSAFLLLCLSLAADHSVHAVGDADEKSDFYVDQSKWVDPGDMLRFDYSKVSLTEERGTQTLERCSCPSDQRFDSPEVDCSKTKEKLTRCKKELSDMSKILLSSDGNPKTDAFFRRLSLILTKKLAEVRADITAGRDLAFEFVIDQKFVDRVTHLQSKGVSETTAVASIVDDVSDILIPLIQKSYLREQESFWVRNSEHFAVAGGTLLSAVLIHLLLHRKIFVVATLSFLVSVAWEWRRLYEEEVIRKEMTGWSGSECRKKGSWLTYLVAGLSSPFVFRAESQDPCHEYYSALGVKTILNVNPASAFKNVIGIVFGGSFAILAKYSGLATANYFSQIPLLWTPFVGVALVVVLIFVMTFSFGYDVRTPVISLTRSPIQRLQTYLQPIRDEHRFVVNGSENEQQTDSASGHRMRAADFEIGSPSSSRRRSLQRTSAARRTQSLTRYRHNC